MATIPIPKINTLSETTKNELTLLRTLCARLLQKKYLFAVLFSITAPSVHTFGTDLSLAACSQLRDAPSAYRQRKLQSTPQQCVAPHPPKTAHGSSHASWWWWWWWFFVGFCWGCLFLVSCLLFPPSLHRNLHALWRCSLWRCFRACARGRTYLRGRIKPNLPGSTRLDYALPRKWFVRVVVCTGNKQLTRPFAPGCVHD